MKEEGKNKKKTSPKLFALQMLAVAVGVYLVMGYLTARFHLGIDDQKNSCLPYKYYVIDRGDHEVLRGGYVAFRSDARMAPWYAERTVFIKRVRAVAGDRVRVGQTGGMEINGASAGQLEPYILQKVGRQAADFVRDETLPQGALWVMGETPDSFDSRYWGYIRADQVVGQVYPIH